MMADTTSSVWRLLVLSGKKYLGLIPHDLGYFRDHFNGAPMSTGWRPPPITISGKSKKLPDFISWMVGAPVVSEKAMLALAPVLNGLVQFFPFHEIKGKEFYAMNVLQVESDLLDLEKSEIVYGSSEPRRVLMIERAIFVEPLPVDLPPIFKVSIRGQILGDIFVTRPFANVLVEHQLTGAALGDPSQYPLKMILAEKPANVVRGVVE